MNVFCFGSFDDKRNSFHLQQIKTMGIGFGVLQSLQFDGTQGFHCGTFRQPFFEMSILAETSGAVSLSELGPGHFLIIRCLHFGCDLLVSTRWQLKCCGTRTSKPFVWLSVLVAHTCVCDDICLWTFAFQQIILV